MNLLTDLLDGIGSLSGKRISVLFFFFFSFATNAKNSKCIDCGRIVKLWHEYYFVLEIKQWMTFEDNRERNIEILARSHSTYRLTLAFFRGRTFDCLVKRRVYIHQLFESTSKLVTRAVLIAQKWQSVLLSTWIRILEKYGIYTKEHNWSYSALTTTEYMHSVPYMHTNRELPALPLAMQLCFLFQTLLF